MHIFRLLILFVGLTWTVPSLASTYYIDLTNLVSNESGLFAPVHGPLQAYVTPVFHLKAGDQVDFGSVTIDPVFSGDGRYNTISLFYFMPSLTVSFDSGKPPPNPYYSSFVSYFYCSPIADCTAPPQPQVDSQTYDLRFILESDTIQLAFSGPFTYEAPIAPAVPEPSTWAMLLIGFAVVGYMSYRRHSHAVAFAA